MDNSSQSEFESHDPSFRGPRNPYSFISLQVFDILVQLRKKLIKMVTEEGKSVYRACRDLDINNSTAKAIIRNYKRKGHIFKRKHEKKSETRNQ